MWLITTDLPGLLTKFLFNWPPHRDVVPETPQSLSPCAQGYSVTWWRCMITCKAAARASQQMLRTYWRVHDGCPRHRVPGHSLCPNSTVSLGFSLAPCDHLSYQYLIFRSPWNKPDTDEVSCCQPDHSNTTFLPGIFIRTLHNQKCLNQGCTLFPWQVGQSLEMGFLNYTSHVTSMLLVPHFCKKRNRWDR